MESLAYLHLALVHETPAEMDLGEPLDWRKFSSLAWTYLLPVIIALGVLGMASQTLAQTYRQGDRSQEITVIQERLRQLGYFNQAPTGRFGSATRQAVIKFQRQNGLAPDGIVGRQTAEVLFGTQRQVRFDTPNSLPLPPPFSSTYPTEVEPQPLARADTLILRRGDRNPDVRRLQQRLSNEGFYFGSIDGIFGAETERAVSQFQTAKGLFPDGIAGSETLTALGIIAEPQDNRYVVVVPIQNENTLYQVRSVEGFANAFEAESKLGKYVNAGTFPNRASAESRSYRLRSQGLDARVAYFR